MDITIKTQHMLYQPLESRQETFLPRNVLSDPTTASQVKPGLRLSAVEEAF